MFPGMGRWVTDRQQSSASLAPPRVGAGKVQRTSRLKARSGVTRGAVADDLRQATESE